ncbi:MAG TPA: PilN domain-containing protein [Pseudoxanthomonas sp.]
MAKINLLPWRAERRAQRQREFYGMLGLAAAAGLVLSFLVWFHYNQQISGQNKRNEFVKAEIAKVEEQIVQIEALDKQKDRLLARKKVIEQLQANRSQMVHLFDSLVRTIPDGVALANIKQEGEILTLEGRSQSNARVSTYMRNLESSGWMTNPDLSIIEAKDEEKSATAPVTSSESRALPYAFTLQVKLANPNAPEQQADGTVVPASTPPSATPAADNTAPAAAPATTTPPAVKPSPAAAPATPPVEQPAPATQGSSAS